MYEQRSSVAGHNEGDSDDEYVNKSEYELDFDLEDINRMKEYQAGNDDNVKEAEYDSPDI